MAPIQKPQELTNLSQTSSVKPFDSIPGPKGLPVIGTLFDYMKKDGFRFNKLFEVGIFQALSNKLTKEASKKKEMFLTFLAFNNGAVW